ncbi:MAG: hypothetical protein OXU42_08655 [Deltaproteobacteria bacterium]|nr:hypothetical protein [Deltaproteobacteria bacterium]
MRPINVEVPDAREGRVRSFIVRMELGELSIRVGTKIPAPGGGEPVWEARLTAEGAREVSSALQLAAARIEMEEHSRGHVDDGDSSDTGGR